MRNSVNYTPPASLVGFLTSCAFVSLVSGPVGSGKSSAAMMKIAYHAKQMRAGRDGVRRSRAVVVRNTNQMLTDATIPTFMTWFPEGVAGQFARTDKRFFLRFDDVECEVLFRGLDDANDVRRLLSLECSFGVLDEYREIHPDIFNALQGRVGRYPSVANGGCVTDDGTPNHHIWGATNAPDADTFWADYMDNPPSTAQIFQQPSALSPECDWKENLIAGYYETLAEGKSEDWVDVYIHNKFGRSLSGTPVYQRTFVQDFHVSTTPLIPVNSPGYPVIIGVDFGRTPAAVFKQRDPRGRVLTLSELTSENMGIETFVKTRLMPHIANKYPGFDFVCAPDPAGFMKQQLNEMTLVDVLKEAGFRCVKPPTNKPEYRIQAVERLLGQQLEGKAMYLIDPGCTQLIKGFRSGYRYKVKKNGELEDSPDKNEFSHCFVGDTPVLTTTGYRSIKDVLPGDYVVTTAGPRQVLCAMSRVAPALVEVTSPTGTVVCTPDHPFIVDGQRVRADALKYVNILERSQPADTPRRVVAASAAVRPHGGPPQVVYDLTVDDTHEFFVAGMLVSNCHDANQYADAIIDMNIRGAGVAPRRRDVQRVTYAYT